MNDSGHSARDLCAFINASPSPFHAVAETVRRLQAVGFTPLLERDAWSIEAGGRYYITRGDASLVAFRAGTEDPVEVGFHILGAHTDSPNLRLKPRPLFASHGYVRMGVEVYGGVLLYTWLDRDLGISGRLVIRSADGAYQSRLVRLHEPLCRVASLAPHLDPEVNKQGLVLNRQTHMVPLFSLGDAEEKGRFLFARLAEAAGIEAEQISGFDLGLYDINDAVVGGPQHEFVFGGRQDNLAGCHAAVSALVAAEQACHETRVISLFDNEEVGSTSAQGAAGTLLKDVLGRIVEGMGPRNRHAQNNQGPARGGLARAAASSFSISVDAGHAVHPSYADKHEPHHMPVLGSGPILKSNTQRRYATDGWTAARFRGMCDDAGVPFQEFLSRADLRCGTTIGPISSAELGIATVDVGNPMLSMHSVREMSGASDVGQMIKVLSHFFNATT